MSFIVSLIPVLVHIIKTVVTSNSVDEGAGTTDQDFVQMAKMENCVFNVQNNPYNT